MQNPNRSAIMKQSPRIWLAEHLLHLGWAFHGQKCECGFDKFNWLASVIGEGKWDANDEPADVWTRINFNICHALVSAHNSLMCNVE